MARKVFDESGTEQIPLAGPRQCKCGHEHYGRAGVDDDPRNGVMWGHCEILDCSCQVLKPV